MLGSSVAGTVVRLIKPRPTLYRSTVQRTRCAKSNTIAIVQQVKNCTNRKTRSMNRPIKKAHGRHHVLSQQQKSPHIVTHLCAHPPQSKVRNDRYACRLVGLIGRDFTLLSGERSAPSCAVGNGAERAASTAARKCACVREPSGKIARANIVQEGAYKIKKKKNESPLPSRKHLQQLIERTIEGMCVAWEISLCVCACVLWGG